MSSLIAPPLSLYVHMPWCVRKCPYCDFNSYTLRETLPEAQYIAYGTNVEQLAGLVSLSGYENGEPLKTGFSYGDPMAGTAPRCVMTRIRCPSMNCAHGGKARMPEPAV